MAGTEIQKTSVDVLKSLKGQSEKLMGELRLIAGVMKEFRDIVREYDQMMLNNPSDDHEELMIMLQNFKKRVLKNKDHAQSYGVVSPVFERMENELAKRVLVHCTEFMKDFQDDEEPWSVPSQLM